MQCYLYIVHVGLHIAKRNSNFILADKFTWKHVDRMWLALRISCSDSTYPIQRANGT